MCFVLLLRMKNWVDLLQEGWINSWDTKLLGAFQRKFPLACYARRESPPRGHFPTGSVHPGEMRRLSGSPTLTRCESSRGGRHGDEPGCVCARVRVCACRALLLLCCRAAPHAVRSDVCVSPKFPSLEPSSSESSSQRLPVLPSRVFCW